MTKGERQLSIAAILLSVTAVIFFAVLLAFRQSETAIAWRLLDCMVIAINTVSIGVNAFNLGWDTGKKRA